MLSFFSRSIPIYKLVKGIKENLHSLRVKVILIYLVLTIVPITVIDIAVYFLWVGMEKESIINYNQKYLNRGKEVLETELSQMSKINLLFNMNTEIQNLLVNISEDDTQYDYKVLKSQWFFIPMLTTLKSISPGIYSFTFFGTNDRPIYSSAFNDPGYCPRNEEWYRQILDSNGDPVILGSHKPYYDRSKNIIVISIGQLMKSYSDQRPIGVTLIDYNLTLFQKRCFNLKYNEDSRILLTNKEGEIIYDTNEQYLNRKISFSLMKRLNAKRSGYVIDDFEGIRSIITFDDVDPSGWKLVSVVPEDKVIQPIRDYLGNINISILLFIYLISMISLVLFNKQLKPLQDVAFLMRKNVENNFKHRIDPPKSNNEISTLCQSFNLMTDKIEKLIEIEYNAKIRQKEAELTALEAQINPHFLYNTLETIRWMAVKQHQDEIAAVIYALSSNLRYSIIDPGKKVKISDEVNWLKNYLFIQSIRFKNKFEVFFEIEDIIMEYKFHKLLLQPFIENSLLHGFENITAGGIILIKGYLEKEKLKFEIVDNGCGFQVDYLDITINTENMDSMSDIGIGISNAVKRIALYYYGKFLIHIKSENGKGTSVKIAIQAEEVNGEKNFIA